MKKDKMPVKQVNKRPLTEEEIAKRRRAKKLRLKKKKEQRQKALILLCALIIVIGVVFGLTRCSSDNIVESDSTTLTITPKGEIIFEEIIARDEDMDEKEIKAFVQSEIDGYRSEDKGAIKIEKVKVYQDDNYVNQAYLRLRYKDVATYGAFTGYDVFFGTVSEAIRKGYSFTAAFARPDGTEISREEAISDSAAKVFIIQENVNVTYSGTLGYVSKEGTKLSSESKTLTISSVDGNSDSAPLTYLIFEEEGEKESK